MAPKITPVILSGGIGTRLWPLSRALRPKQLLPLTSEKSLLQETVLRTKGTAFGPPLVVCNEEHRFMIAEQLRELDIAPEAIILEPEGRNTAPAIASAALYLAQKDGNMDGIMLVMPSDHVIQDTEAFRSAVDTAIAAAQREALVSFGIQPSRAETGYGYIRCGEPYDGVSGCFKLAEFVEKPDVETAQSYVSKQEYYWNSGIFVFPVGLFLHELEAQHPGVVGQCRKSIMNASSDLDFVRLSKSHFQAAESISVDYAVMERTDKGAIVPADMAWNDVGSWSALWEIGARDDEGNVITGDAITLDAKNCFIRSDSRLVAAIGIEDLVIVSTDDVILIAHMDRDQDVKKLVEELAKRGRSEHKIPRQVFRPWGWYRNIHEGYRFQVKEIVVNPGEKLSAQMHHHRAEHWIVVSGTAEVTKGNEAFYMTEDESTYIPHTTKHCLANPGKIPLKMIEVQSGAYLGEDDIVRYEDRYGRVSPETPKS